MELICCKLLGLLHKHGYQKVSGLSSLWGAGTTACIHEEQAQSIAIGVVVLIMVLIGLLFSHTEHPLASTLSASQRVKELLIGFQRQPKSNLCELTTVI